MPESRTYGSVQIYCSAFSKCTFWKKWLPAGVGTNPFNQAGFTKAPNLGNAIVDNIRNREDQQSGCYGNTKNLDNFSLKKIGCNQAYIEQ